MNEKMRILKMIENGQLTAAEAVPLLQAMEAGGAKPTPEPVKTGRSNTGNSTDGGAQSGLDDLGQKFESFAREVAPKVEKFAGAVAAQIAGAAEKVSDVFASPEAPRTSQTAPPPAHRPASAQPKPAAKPGGIVTAQIEMAVDLSVPCELNLSAMNGDIRVKGYNGDKITAHISSVAKKAGATIELVKLGGKYFLKYEPEEFSMVAIDAFVPERAFGMVRISGTNGRLDIASLSAGEVNFTNANGVLSAKNISAKKATIENINAPIDAAEIDVSQLAITNYNSPLALSISAFSQYADYDWSIETGNAKLNISLPTAPNLGYHVKAHAAMGEIMLGLTGLQYLINEPSLVEAQSVNFGAAAKKVKISVETSNASLAIN